MLATLSRRGSCSAGELGDLFDSAQPTISKHLRVLEAAELVQRRVEGRRHLFSLNPTRIQQAQNWLKRHLEFWEDSLDRLESVIEELKLTQGKSNHE
jgi:DNA-binding transcriptional ArsR family regulator